MKLLHPFLHSPLTEPQIDLWKESSAMLKFKVYSCFFKLTSCAVGQEWSSVTSKKVRHKKLAAIGCYCLTWRRWTTNTVVEPEKRLSFIDDWRRYCCSWLKWRRGGATSVFIAPTGGVLRRKVNDVFLMWDMDWQCFHKRLCRHSLSTLEVQHLFKQIEFSYFTFDALNFLLTKSLIGPHSLFPNFSQSSIVDLGWGNLLFILVHTWQMYEHVIYMMNTPFEGWHIVVTFIWWNKNLDSCPNSTMKIFWVTIILSPTSLEFKMLQEGFALMQITIAHTT